MTRIMMTLVLAASAVLAAQQRLTLPELARRQAPKPVSQMQVAELIAVSLDQMLPRADLVVHGTVTSATTYLSADQMDLFTDSVIHPLRVIWQRNRTIADRPGSTPLPVIVKRWGGQMIIEGVKVTQENHDVRAFHVGEQVLLLLTYDKEDKKYGVSSPSGIFSVAAMRIEPFVQGPPFDQFRGKSIPEFELEVRRLSR